MTRRGVRVSVVALVTTIALMTSVLAQSRKILVLPLDGDAPADKRDALSRSVVNVAKARTGAEVTLGDTTYAETAAAVGCVPTEPACAEQVRTTLAVDELVYGTATTENGATTVSITRLSAGAAPQSATGTLAETETVGAIEARLDSAFGGAPAGSDAPQGSGSADPAVPATPHRSFFDTTERKLAVGMFAAGAISVAIGLSLWSGASGLQDDIDSHATSTLTQINDLKDTEDRAASKALWGNVLVFGGLAVAGVGGYFLYKDHKKRSEPMLAPAPAPSGTGMTLVFRGQW